MMKANESSSPSKSRSHSPQSEGGRLRSRKRRSPESHKSRSYSPVRTHHGSGHYYGYEQEDKKRSRDSPERHVNHNHPHHEYHHGHAEHYNHNKSVQIRKKPLVALSFNDDLLEDEQAEGYVKKVKGVVDQITSERMKEERFTATTADTGLAALAASSSSYNSHHPIFGSAHFSNISARSLQIVDDEEEEGPLMDDQKGEEERRETSLMQPLLTVGVGHTRGPKAVMEDRHVIMQDFPPPSSSERDASSTTSFFAVYDGHGGERAAELAVEHFHTFLVGKTKAFLATEEEETQHEQENTAFNTNNSNNNDNLCGNGNHHHTTTMDDETTRIVVEAYKKTDDLILQTLKEEGNRQDGSAALTAIIAKNHVYIANIGDCRAVLGCRSDINALDGRLLHTLRLSHDHKPNLPEEKQRIVRAGGNVSFTGVWRVSHPSIPVRLSLSRSFGDPAFKRNYSVNATGDMAAPPRTEQLVSAEPFTRHYKLNGSELCLILASDGVWDTITDEDAVRLVVNIIRGISPSTAFVSPSVAALGTQNRLYFPWAPTELKVKEAADALITTALSRGSYDNATCVVIAFQFGDLKKGL